MIEPSPAGAQGLVEGSFFAGFFGIRVGLRVLGLQHVRIELVLGSVMALEQREHPSEGRKLQDRQSPRAPGGLGRRMEGTKP